MKTATTPAIAATPMIPTEIPIALPLGVLSPDFSPEVELSLVPVGRLPFESVLVSLSLPLDGPPPPDGLAVEEDVVVVAEVSGGGGGGLGPPPRSV